MPTELIIDLQHNSCVDVAPRYVFCML